MPANTIIIVDSTPVGRARRDWKHFIELHWPTPSCTPCPTVTEIPEEDYLSGNRVVPASAVILALGDQGPTTQTYQLLDVLAQRNTAVLVLCDDPKQHAERLGSVYWAASDTDAAQLTARMEALLTRQGCVDALVAETVLAKRLQGGVSGEMAHIHEEMELAASVQREFLPRGLPEAPGLEFAILYRPSSYVSGDIYDVRALDDEHVGFFLADATGHGVPAALMTVLVSRGLTLREDSEDGNRLLTPGEALARLNDELASRPCSGRRFATAICGCIHVPSRDVVIATAGHPPPLIVTESFVREVPTGGSLLGVFCDEQYENTRFTLQSGERLILFTDGFELAFPAEGDRLAKRRLPTERYLEEFAKLCTGSLNDALLALEARVDAQYGSLHQVDDLTVVAIGADTASQTSPLPAVATRAAG